MTPWQVLRAREATRAASGYRAHHGPGVLLHYSTAPDAADAAEAPDCSRSFCLSREKLSLQQLNRRLDSYLQQVHCLEEANQRLERQIQEELDRKCPRELRKLDRHLRTSSLLQDKISDCLLAQAQVKLQLLSAELIACDLKVRCEKEHERRGCLEVELRNLRLLEEELQVHRLPELQSLLNDRTQQVMQLQIQHQQDMQVLLAWDSGGPVVEMHTAESSDLNQQLDDLRRTNVTLFDKNQNECWFNTQVSMLSSPEATIDPAAGSEVVQAELEELKRTAASLEEELTQLQTLNMVLEASGLEQNESLVLQLVVLQQKADGLCRDLDSLLQAAAQQAADHQALLDVKSRLETEIQDYRRLLDGLRPHGVSSLHSNSVANVTSFCATNSPSAFRRNITANKTVSVQGGNLRMMEVPQGFTTVVPDTQFARSAAVQAKPKTFTSKQTTAEVGLQANKTGTNIQTEITKTIQCAEPEVKQRPHPLTHMATTDPSKQTAAEVKKETETVISAQMNCIEGFIQTKNQDPAQVVSLSLETPAVTASVFSGSYNVRSEEAQSKVSGELTLMDDKDIEQQEREGEEEVVEVEGTSLVLRLDQSSALYSPSNSEQDKVVEEADTGSGTATASSSSPDSNDNLESKTAQGITTWVSDTQSARSAAVQAEPETFTSKQTTAEVGLLANKTGTNIQTHTSTTDLKQTAAEVKKETETVISAQMNCIEGSIQAENQDPAQVVSLSLETPVEAIVDAGEVAVTASFFSESPIPRSEEAQGKVSGELASIDDKDIEQQEKQGEEEEVEVEGTSLVLRLDQSSALSDASNSEQNKVVEDADTGSGTATASSSSPDSNDSLESKTESTEIFKTVDLEVKKGKVVNGSHDTHKIKVDPSQSANEMVNLEGPEALLSTTESKKLSALTDSGVALSSSGPIEILSQREAHVFVSPTKPAPCLSPEICLSPVETVVLMSMTDQVFCPVDPEECVKSPDSLLRPNDSETCLSPVEAKMCLSPNGEEEDEEVCLSLTEANAHVRPVEKYILSTKEEGQSLSLSGDQARYWPEQDSNKKVNISLKYEDSLYFGSFKCNKGSGGTLNGTNSRPTSQENGLQLSSSLGGLEFGGPDGRSIIADKEENIGTGSMCGKSVRDARSPGDRCKESGGITDNKYVQNPGGSPEGSYGLEAQKRTYSHNEVRGQKNNDWLVANMPDNSDRVLVKSANFGSVSANVGTSFCDVTSNSGGIASSNSGMAASFGGTAANSLGTVSGNAEAATTAGVQGRFRHDSEEWMFYGGSLGHTSTSLTSTGKKESPSGAMLPATSQSDTGKFSSRGSGGWMVYNLGRKRSLDGGNSLPSEGKEEGPSVATTSATSSRETRFGSRGSGEWLVYGGSLGRKSSLPSTRSEKSSSVVMVSATSQPEIRGSGGSGKWMVYSGSLKRTSSDSLPNTDSRQSLPMAMHLTTNPPGTQMFDSRAIGEWRVYGGSTGSMSSWAGSNSLPNADNEEIPSVAVQLATSQPGALAAERFASGGSGEWRVYGGSTGCLSSAGSEDRISVSAHYSKMICSPSSHTSSRPRLSSVGSGGRLSSGSVVRRSSSVGSGSRLSSSGSGSRLSNLSGSHRTSSSGRFASTSSGELKPVYSSASGRRSSVGSAGRSGGGGTTSSQRAPSPGGRISVNMGSGGWLSISNPGSGSKLSSAGSNERISSRTGGRISSSSGSGRTNSTGGRVISSSSRPIRSTGSGGGGNKERISVCKMAALSISAAVRERNQGKQRQTQWSQQQQGADTSPLVQRWLTTGVGVTSADLDGLDDVMRL